MEVESMEEGGGARGSFKGRGSLISQLLNCTNQLTNIHLRRQLVSFHTFNPIINWNRTAILKDSLVLVFCFDQMLEFV